MLPARQTSLCRCKISETDCNTDTTAKCNFNQVNSLHRAAGLPVHAQEDSEAILPSWCCCDACEFTSLHITFLIHTFLLFVDEISLMKLSKGREDSTRITKCKFHLTLVVH